MGAGYILVVYRVIELEARSYEHVSSWRLRCGKPGSLTWSVTNNNIRSKFKGFILTIHDPSEHVDASSTHAPGLKRGGLEEAKESRHKHNPLVALIAYPDRPECEYEPRVRVPKIRIVKKTERRLRVRSTSG